MLNWTIDKIDIVGAKILEYLRVLILEPLASIALYLMIGVMFLVPFILVIIGAGVIMRWIIKLFSLGYGIS